MSYNLVDPTTGELTQVAGNAANADLKDMNVYSTEEKIVGTWIDGKPIYRTTIKLSSDMSHESLFPILNVDTMVDYGGTIYATASRHKRSFPWTIPPYKFDINGWYSAGVYLFVTDNNVPSIIGSGSIVWFEYTKTTD